MSEFAITQGDTLPALSATLTDRSGIPVDLSAAGVVFQMQRLQGGPIVVSGTCSVAPKLTATVTTAGISGGVATIGTAAPHGFSTGDIVILSGVGDPFDGAWTITTASGSAFSFATAAANRTAAAASGTAVVQGKVSYTWQPGDTATAGAFRGDFVVTFPGPDIETFPDSGDFVSIVVSAQLPVSSPTFDSPCSLYCTPVQVRQQYPTIDPSVDVMRWCQVATNILYRLTGRQAKGLCSVTIRPGHQSCSCGGACEAHAIGWPFGSYAGYWGYPAAAITSLLSAPPQLLCASEIDLGPDCRSVSSVKIDGHEVDPATWRLDPLGKLVRQPDPANGQPMRWPCCERADAPSGSPGTFEITYAYGDDPPADLVAASTNFAGELSLGAAPATAGQCKLPAHTQTATRQGVTAALITDLTVLIDRGYSGLPFVDRVIKSMNPEHLQRRARILSPDVPSHRIMGFGE